jgi:outer membrane receptor protein involved in Fe transport
MRHITMKLPALLFALPCLAALTALAMSQPALAQEAVNEIPDVEVPTLVIDAPTDLSGPVTDDSELDLANIVLSAAKGITTVQEAPAIVTVVTSDEIAERQFNGIEAIMDTVPGWYRGSVLHSQFPTALVRGQAQSSQFLHDSISLFDPFVNAPSTSRVLPVELIKRVEMITGPGGVLWGSNSLLGILNIITKDADDVDGVEVGATGGGGDGDRRSLHAYAMVGASDLLDGKVKLFAHGSFETYQGAEHEFPMLVVHQPLPQPNSPNLYGPLISSDQPQSYLFNLNAKVTIGKLQLRFAFPFGERHNPVGLSGNPIRESLPNDDVCPSGTEPVPGTIATCLDPERDGRNLQVDYFDRYAVGEYRTRFSNDRAGLSLKGYLVQFVRRFSPLQILAPSSFPNPLNSPTNPQPPITLLGGLGFEVDNTSYRAGGALDGDAELSRQIRVLYGAEAFSEWKPVNTERSRQGEGTEATFSGPTNLDRALPVLCPRDPDITFADGTHPVLEGCPVTFAFPATRTVFGAYINPQYRPSKKLIFDAGARVQVSPEALGKLSYPVNTTFAGTVVWNFIPNWHVKVNFAQGFRPPVFNNTTANGTAVQINGNPDLKVETSDAAQAEINARIFKGDRRIRELSFRVDGSYTRLQNLIQINSGTYQNTGERALLSGEFLGKLYIQGGHRLELGYTYLMGTTTDRGRLRSLPEHWFNLGAVFNIVDDKLTGTTNMRIAGASEDPNRIVEYRDQVLDERGGTAAPQVVTASELVYDRLPASAELTLGVTWRVTAKLSLRGTVYNALDSHHYQPDAFFDYEPRLEYLPNPYERIRGYLTAEYKY